MSGNETIRVYDARATEYAEMTDDYNGSDPRLSAFIAACPPGGYVLDLGCGPGAAAAEMARAGLNVDATDGSLEMLALANRHSGVDARQALFDDISGENLYDGVWANFSLLHAPRAAFPGHLRALHRALKPGRTFFIGMKLGTGEAADALGRHYTYYSQDELEGHLREAGFTVLNSEQDQAAGLDGTMSDIISVAASA